MSVASSIPLVKQLRQKFALLMTGHLASEVACCEHAEKAAMHNVYKAVTLRIPLMPTLCKGQSR